jgi:DNA-binding NtrC family response regulator
MNCLLKYHWPGNVRELENLVERLTILVSNKVVTIADLPEKFRQTTNADIEQTRNVQMTQKKAEPVDMHLAPVSGVVAFGDGDIDFNKIVGTLERNLIMKALEKAGGVRSKAAQLLKLNRTTLLEKMKKMGIDMKNP